MAESQRGSEQPQHEHDLEAGQDRREVNRGSADRSMSWLTLSGLSFLTFNSVMAIYRAQRDLQSVAFVAISYVDLVLLFALFLRRNERARDKLKLAVWILTTLLTLAFGYGVATVMPLPMAVLVWAMAGAALFGNYYAFFVRP